MHTSRAFTGLVCPTCTHEFAPQEAPHRCPDCEGWLDATYDTDLLADAHEQLFEDTAIRAVGLSRFAAVLPFPKNSLVTLTEGETPVVDCPTVATACDVGRVLCKDEGRNPTGGVVDREMAVAVTAAAESGADTVVLPSTGNGGQAAAAYASRAGLTSEVFVPSRSTFENKAMINVHGGEMNVVGGRYPDAVAAFEEAQTSPSTVDEGEHRYSLAPFETPYRQEGAKTLAYELLADLDSVPDAIVYPTGHGTGLVGLSRGFEELERTGTIERLPRLYATQPEGCAPLAQAFVEGKDVHEAVTHPDTICGPLEIPDPAGGEAALSALETSDGGAVSPTDEEILEAALSLAQEGVPVSATGGTALAGLERLAEEDAFTAEETVVVVNPGSANREADLLRNQLMRKGI